MRLLNINNIESFTHGQLHLIILQKNSQCRDYAGVKHHKNNTVISKSGGNTVIMNSLYAAICLLGKQAHNSRITPRFYRIDFFASPKRREHCGTAFWFNNFS